MAHSSGLNKMTEKNPFLNIEIIQKICNPRANTARYLITLYNSGTFVFMSITPKLLNTSIWIHQQVLHIQLQMWLSNRWQKLCFWVLTCKYVIWIKQLLKSITPNKNKQMFSLVRVSLARLRDGSPVRCTNDGFKKKKGQRLISHLDSGFLSLSVSWPHNTEWACGVFHTRPSGRSAVLCGSGLWVGDWGSMTGLDMRGVIWRLWLEGLGASCYQGKNVFPCYICI